MATIGILGDNTNETVMMLYQICKKNGINPVNGYYKLTEDNVIPIVSIDENACKRPKVFILQEPTNSVFCVPSSPYPGGIITYGFNGKASVTASSISDDALQVCIQRGFKTLSGIPYEPQEFKTPYPQEVNPLNVLGAVTACAVCDILS